MNYSKLRQVISDVRDGVAKPGRVLDQLEANGYVRRGRLTRNGRKLVEREERLGHLSKKVEKVQEYREISAEEFLEDEDKE